MGFEGFFGDSSFVNSSKLICTPNIYFHIPARSSLKKFENEKWPKAGYLLLYLAASRRLKKFFFKYT